MSSAEPATVAGYKRTGHEVTDSDFLEAIATRVRKARAHKGFSRKLLSERSGVSERYLALLESGRGNLSVLLLRQVSAALDLAPDALISDYSPTGNLAAEALGLPVACVGNGFMVPAPVHPLPHLVQRPKMAGSMFF